MPVLPAIVCLAAAFPFEPWAAIGNSATPRRAESAQPLLAPSPPAPDFDGDGFADLAAGVPGEGVGSVVSAGAVMVLYGASGGLTAAGDQLWHQDSPGIATAAEVGDGFGSALAWGDFNADGFHDLAIGADREDLGPVPGSGDQGAVHVLYGGPGGLSAAGSQFWHQDIPEVLDDAEAQDLFGSALTAGDFDGNGFDDLAVGVRGESIGAIAAAGGVQILYGSSKGLAATFNQLWHQDQPDVLDAAGELDSFGTALTAGDFDLNGIADLAVGVPGEEVSGLDGAGAVAVLYGTSSGLKAVNNQLWTQDSPSVLERSEGSDDFGRAVDAGDFDGDAVADLAIGNSEEQPGGLVGAGAVNVLYGSAGVGLTAAGNQLWHQNSPGILDVAETGDLWGLSLEAGDFDGDAFADLAVAAPFEDLVVGGVDVEDAGAVAVLYGGMGGLSAAGDQLWHQNRPGVPDAAQEGDALGMALAAADFDGDAFFDLVAGVPGEEPDGGSVLFAGAVNVFFGGLSGLSSSHNEAWSQDSPGILDSGESSDQMGTSLDRR